MQLSIILTTHTPETHFESLLQNILSIASPYVETIIINDAASPAMANWIHSGIEQSQNERVFLFEHTDPAGRGLSLNEALIQASGSFIWAPLRADRFNITLLLETLQRLKSDPAAFWTLDYSLPDSIPGWIEAAAEGELPDDSCLIWNRAVIQPSALFFNPFMHHLHGAELAFRLHHKNRWHQTDPFFVVADHQSPPAGRADLTELLHTAYRFYPSVQHREKILGQLAGLNTEPERPDHKADDTLLQARRLMEQGDAKRALELINHFLKKDPEHHEANRLKITALEKLRRHVEAAELKHDLNKRSAEQIKQAELFLDKTQTETSSRPRPKEIELSVIIPTTAMGKPLLEQSLLHLEPLLDADTSELIIIDNASTDDTFDYLEQLGRKNFLNIRVISNPANRGFGASVNQGIQAAKGGYLLILHNDVTLQKNCIPQLKEALEYSSEVVLAAPLLNPSENHSQNPREEFDAPFVESDQAESCCFMIRSNLPIRFDEDYRLCHFDMEDFCRQLTDRGHKIAIARQTVAEHSNGPTKHQLGIKLLPWLKWQNRQRLAEKWSLTPQYSMPKQGTHPDRFEQLGPPENPIDPNPQWLETVQKYLTDEVKTEILRRKWSDRELITIVSTLLIADERELLRTLEDRLDELDLPTPLLVLFVTYYFNKNIYSRCKHYLAKAGNSHTIFDLFRLKIRVADKELDQASGLLNKLLEQHPASPDVYHLAGQMYRQQGDEEEARSFFTLAHQLDPYRFTNEDAAFEIKF